VWGDILSREATAFDDLPFAIQAITSISLVVKIIPLTFFLIITAASDI
jgi:hypothetical protein